MFELWDKAREIARQKMKAYSISGMVIEISIAVLILAILVGIVAFPIFFDVSTAGWGANNILIWGVLPTVALAVIIVGIVQHFRSGGGGKAYSLSGTVIEIAIAMLVLAILLGTIALPIFFTTCTSTWGATNATIWWVVPTVALAAVIVGLVSHFRHKE